MLSGEGKACNLAHNNLIAPIGVILGSRCFISLKETDLFTLVFLRHDIFNQSGISLVYYSSIGVYILQPIDNHNAAHITMILDIVIRKYLGSVNHMMNDLFMACFHTVKALVYFQIALSCRYDNR